MILNKSVLILQTNEFHCRDDAVRRLYNEIRVILWKKFMFFHSFSPFDTSHPFLKHI